MIGKSIKHRSHEERLNQFDEVFTFMVKLGIPFEVIEYYLCGYKKGTSYQTPIDGSISMFDLYDILNDKENLEVLILKLK